MVQTVSWQNPDFALISRFNFPRPGDTCFNRPDRPRMLVKSRTKAVCAALEPLSGCVRQLDIHFY